MSTPDALIRNAGPDGISLREAILAANNVPGPHTITFSEALAGQTIRLTSLLPTITRSGVTIAGIASPDGQPAVGVDAGGALRSGFNVQASDFSISHMRVARVRQGGGAAVNVEAGAAIATPNAPARVENIRIESNVFTNVGVDDTGFGVALGMRPGSSGAILRNVRIANNRFLHYSGDGDAVSIGATGSGDLLEDVSVQNNDFSETTFPVELVLGGTDGLIRRVSVTGNVFTANQLPVSLGILGLPGTVSSGNRIEDVLISSNTFQNNTSVAVFLLGGFQSNARNVIRGTRIIRNQFLSTNGGIGLSGGSDSSGENRIEQTLIEGNVFSSTTNPVAITGGSDSTRGNVISETQILNNRFTPAAGISITAGNRSSNRNRVEHTVISGNVATSTPGALVSITAGGDTARDSVVFDTVIENNRVIGGGSGVSAVAGRGQSSANRIEHTVVTGNVFSSPLDRGVQFTAGTDSATASEIADVQVLNNLITGARTFGALNIIGGGRDNRVVGAGVINNTIAQNPSGGIGLVDNGIPASLTDIKIANTILWDNSPDFGGFTTGRVQNCITLDPQLKGINGNIGADPRFVNAAQGDFYLQPGSPAIDAGASEDAPLRDLEGRTRFDDPATPNRGIGPALYYDIGAYEFTGAVPQFGITAVVNSASFAAGLVPGSLATIFGRGLIPINGTVVMQNASTAGIAVNVGARPAPVLSATKGVGVDQISFQVPFEFVSDNSAVVETLNNGSRFSIPSVPVLISQPGIFEVFIDAQGTRVAAVIHQDGRLVTPFNAAMVGEIVSLFLTGAGAVNPPVETGAPGPSPPSLTKLPTVVGVDDTGAPVLFSGYAPQAIGLYQINFEIPAGIRSSSSVKLNVKIGDSFSQAASIAIQP